MKAKDTVIKIAEGLGHPARIDIEYALACHRAGIRTVVECINDLIIGIEGCKFEERLDGDKGCIVLDMNESQWQDQLKHWGLECNSKVKGGRH